MKLSHSVQYPTHNLRYRDCVDRGFACSDGGKSAKCTKTKILAEKKTERDHHGRLLLLLLPQGVRGLPAAGGGRGGQGEGRTSVGSGQEQQGGGPGRPLLPGGSGDRGEITLIKV